MIIALQQVKQLLGIKPMVRSTPWANSLDIVALYPLKQELLGINPMVIGSAWVDSLDIIFLQPVQND